jgi:hypothetical protein
MNHELVRPEPLFHHLFAGEEGYLATCYPDPETGYWPHKFRHYPTEVEKAAADVIHVAQQGINSYFCVHLLKSSSSRRGDNAMPTVLSLWLDEDEGCFPADGPEPTAIIHSSRKRRHLYWRLAHPVSVEFAVGLNRRIAAWADGDASKAGLASVLRPAGTANFKREKPDLVGGHLTGTPAWEPQIIDQAVPPLPEPEQPKGFSGPYDGPRVLLHEYLENVEVIRERRDSKGVCLEIICPWVHEHSGGDRTGTRVGQRKNGALWFHCDHEHCDGRKWQEFRKKVGRSEVWTMRKPPGYTGADKRVRIHYV